MSFKGVLKVFQSCFKDVSRVFKDILRVFQEYSRKFQCDKRMFKGSLRGLLRAFHKCMKKGKFPECFMKILGCFKSVSSKFDMFLKICFKEVTRFTKRILMAFQANFKGDSRVFQGLFNEVSSVLQASFEGNFKNISWKFQVCFHSVSRKCLRCFKGVSWHSSQLPEQKEGLFRGVIGSAFHMQLKIGVSIANFPRNLV